MYVGKKDLERHTVIPLPCAKCKTKVNHLFIDEDEKGMVCERCFMIKYPFYFQTDKKSLKQREILTTQEELF